MKTILLEEPGKLVAAEGPEPGPPGPGEALVAVRRIGICGTDIHAYHGRQPFFSYPRVLGHELCVEILEVGPNEKGLVPGDRCAVEPYLNCGQCIACRRGKPNCCTTLKVLGVHVDGGHCERMRLPVAKLHRSATLGADALALVEPLGIGAHAVDRASLEPGETVLVIGAGPIGLAVIQFAVVAGARVIAMDVNPERLEFSRHLGVVETVLAGDTAADQLADLTDGAMPTAVFDATGNPASMMGAFRYPSSGGRLVFVGLFQGEVSFNDPDFHRRELTILASRNARPDDFTRIIGLMEEGRVDTRPWITHRASFADAVARFPAWTLSGTGVLKAVIEVEP